MCSVHCAIGNFHSQLNQIFRRSLNLNLVILILFPSSSSLVCFLRLEYSGWFLWQPELYQCVFIG